MQNKNSDNGTNLIICHSTLNNDSNENKRKIIFIYLFINDVNSITKCFKLEIYFSNIQ